MNGHDLTLLSLGAGVGAYLMLLGHLLASHLDDYRKAKKV
jgi:hypothetical protein